MTARQLFPILLAEAWLIPVAPSGIHRAVREVETCNPEHKPLVFSIFGQLAGASRG